MHDFIGKSCPYCKTPFQPDDDIVICSNCEMPHHKDCWIENQGCTTFGCLGTIKSADGGAASVTATRMEYYDQPVSSAVFCMKCGAQDENTSAFCYRCGTPLHAVPTQAPVYTQRDPYEGVDAEILQMVGENKEYYASAFKSVKSQGYGISWNWAAFLATPFWLFYRKMYIYGIVLMAGLLTIMMLSNHGMALVWLCWAVYIAFGLFGNIIYMKHLEYKLGQSRTMSELYRTQFLEKNSGASSTAMILSIVGYALIVAAMLI